MDKVTLNPKSEINFKKGFVAFICAFFICIGVVLILGYMFVPLSWALDNNEAGFSPIASLLFWLFVGGVTYWLYKKSDSIKRIFYKTFVILAIISFIFPVSIFIAGLRFTAQQSEPFGMLGAGIGTGIAFVFAAFFGILLGLAFSISAYFLGRNLNSIPKAKSKQKESKIVWDTKSKILLIISTIILLAIISYSISRFDRIYNEEAAKIYDNTNKQVIAQPRVNSKPDSDLEEYSKILDQLNQMQKEQYEQSKELMKQYDEMTKRQNEDIEKTLNYLNQSGVFR